MYNEPLSFLPALLAISLSTTGVTFNRVLAQEAKPKTTPVLLHVFTGLSMVHPELEGSKNSGRSGMVVTHYRSGWGIGYARQRLEWRGDGASYRQTGWLGSYTIEPDNAMTARSIMAIKEFHLRSTDLFRPCLEAGVSFIEFNKDELVETVYSPEYTSRKYVPATSHIIGFDARFRAFLPISRVFAFEAALHANFNEVRSYASIEFGFALGMVRPPKAKDRN
jgi:hypothetical protein